MRNTFYQSIVVIMSLSSLTFSCGRVASETSKDQSLVSPAAARWPDPRHIPLCWTNPEDTDPEVLRVYQAKIEEEYSHRAGIIFTGFGKCQNFTPQQLSNNPTIRIRLNVEGTTYNVNNGSWGAPGGVSYTGKYSGIGNLDNANYGTKVGAPRTWVPIEGLRRYLLDTLIHELGHALGLHHEQVRSDISDLDRAKDCSKNPGGDSESGNIPVGSYDPNSIMNYCRPSLPGAASLSNTDLQGLDFMYRSSMAGPANWSCMDAQGKALGSVIINWGHKEGDATWACNQWLKPCKDGSACTAKLTEFMCVAANGEYQGPVKIWWGFTAGDASWACNEWKVGRCNTGSPCSALSR